MDGAFVPQTEDFAVIGAIIPLDDQRVFIDGWARPTEANRAIRTTARAMGMTLESRR